MIGYVIEQELGNLLPVEQPLATVLTMIEVDPRRSRVREPDQTDRTGLRQGHRRAAERRAAVGRSHPTATSSGGWWPARNPSASSRSGRSGCLSNTDVIVICAGGGGIPTMYDDDGKLHGVEAVIDKDLAAGAAGRATRRRPAGDRHRRRRRLHRLGQRPSRPSWARSPSTRLVEHESARRIDGAQGRSGMRIRASTAGEAVIGSLADIADIVGGTAGTRVRELQKV